MANVDAWALVARTQEIDIEAQLKLGVRALQVQVHL